MGFVKGGFNLLPGETSSEYMGVASTCGRLGERQSQQSSAKEGFVKFKRLWAEFSNLNSWGFDPWVAEAVGVVIFSWEGEWAVGVSAVHSLHDPPVTC
jgi:hypothetical protein